MKGSEQCGGADAQRWQVNGRSVRRSVSDIQVIIAIPVLLVGGTEMQTLHQVRALVAGGYRVTVCCYYNHDQTIVKLFLKAGADVVLLDADPAEGLLSLLRKLLAFFRQHSPAIVHVQYMAPGFIPVFAARLAGVPTILATVHQPGRTYGWKAHLLLRMASHLCTSFFCNSLSVERSWFGDASLFAPHQQSRKHCTIYNAVDVNRIASLVAAVDQSALRHDLGLAAGPVIGCVGRLRHEKGQGTLIAAMVKVIRQFPDTSLLMVGDGTDREALQRQAEELGIGDNIVWVGRCDGDEVFRMMGVMDIAVVPSLFEGFGLTAAEAMAAGVPVVASQVDGLAEVVAHEETGLLVPPGDAPALAKALKTLIENSNLRQEYGRNARVRVQAMFSMEKFAVAMRGVYAGR